MTNKVKVTDTETMVIRDSERFMSLFEPTAIDGKEKG